MNIFEVLEYGSIVWGNEGHNLFVVWNHKQQFNIFMHDYREYYTNIDAWNSMEEIKDVVSYVTMYMYNYIYIYSKD